MDLQNFIKKFQIPEVAYPFINKIFTKEEIEFVDKMDKDAFTKKDIEKIIDENSDEFIKIAIEEVLFHLYMKKHLHIK